MLLAPADLIDPDIEEIAQPAGIELIDAHASDDPPDRAPVDPEHPLDRCLVGARRQPRDEAFEVARELRAWAGERDALSARPVLGAPKTPPSAMDLKPPGPEIQVPPDRVLRPRVLARSGRVLAQRADKAPASQRDLDDHPARLKPNLLDPDALQAQKPGKCARDAHVVLPRKPLTIEQPAACLEGAAARQQPARNLRAIPETPKVPLKTTNRVSP